MDKDRWSIVNRIFHAALEVDPSQRHSLVVIESNGDVDLQAEVELLLQADMNAGTFLESPLISAESLSSLASPLAPGDVLCGRFRIIREIAEGGMGYVFEAFDNELAVRVALKVILPEIASNPNAIARFRQEVRLARSITHPNICRTFDLEREIRVFNKQRTELVFLTMEFLSGETLATRIKRSGPLPVSEVLRLARQVASALHAAHKLGIIHRDMKPANIMLVAPELSTQDGPRAVITDFGLARLDPLLLAGDHFSSTKTGSPIGTFAYMAPEQLEGTDCSPSTDIYAFGLILFEMITGKRAFHANNLLSGITQRLQKPFPLEQLLAPDVPAHWRSALEMCLCVKPSDRPQDALDVITVLEGDRPRPRNSEVLSKKLLGRVSAIVATLLVTMALFLVGLRLYQSRSNPEIAPGALVYLTQIKNQTGETNFDSLTALIQAALAQSAHINLLDQSRVADIMQQMTKPPNTAIEQPVAREIAMRAGAVRIIFATVTGSNGAYTLNIDIQQPDESDPSSYRDNWTRNFTWQTSNSTSSNGNIPSKLLVVIRNASNWIRKETGESSNDIARLDAPPEDITTNSWNALSEYVSAEHMNIAGHQDDAVTLLENATNMDPAFSLAYARLGDTLLSLDRSDEGYKAYIQALNSKDLRRLTRRERDRIRGIYASDTWDYQTAELAFRDYSAFYENDYLGWFYQALPLKMLGRTDESIAVLRRAIALNPNSVASTATLADHLIILGRYKEANQWIEFLRAHGYQSEADWRAGDIAFLSMKYEKAESFYNSLFQSHQPYYASIGSSQLARLSAERGQYAKAIAALTIGMARDREGGNRAQQAYKLMDIAYLNLKLSNYEDCLSHVEQSLSIEPSPRAYILASALVGKGFQQAPKSTAKRFLKELVRLQHTYSDSGYGIISDVATLRLHGEVLLASGDYKNAISEFSKAAKIDSPAQGKEYLARALEVAAKSATTANLARVLRQRARDAYAAFAFHPAYVWDQDKFYPPGFLMDVTTSYLHLALATGGLDAQGRTCLSSLATLREEEISSSLDLQRAFRQQTAENPPTTP